MIAGIVGVLATAAGLIACIYAIEQLEDFRNPAVPLRLAMLGALFMWSISFALLGFAVRFLRFSFLGRAPIVDGLFRTLLLGGGMFLPRVHFFAAGDALLGQSRVGWRCTKRSSCNRSQCLYRNCRSGDLLAHSVQAWSESVNSMKPTMCFTCARTPSSGRASFAR